MLIAFIISSLLLAAAAIFEIYEHQSLSEARRNYDAAQSAVLQLEQQNKTLRLKNAELSQQLETERINAEMLKQAFLDAEFPVDIVEETEISEGLPLPTGHTNVISGMPYTAITNKQSEQWKLQLEATTDENGIRRYNGYILAAIGSAYTHTIGDAFHVTLRCGSEFDVMCGDFKDDGSAPFFGHPAKNYDGQTATCILEFIYDDDKLDDIVYYAGTFTALQEYGGLYGDGGDIVKIEYLGRKWSR